MTPIRLVTTALLAAAVLFAGTRAYVALTASPAAMATVAEATPATAATSRLSSDAPVTHQLNLADLQRMTATLGNPLERSDNLRQIYERLRDSRYGFERSVAFRAWSACFPQFMSADGQAVSLDKLFQALPLNAPDNALRVEAYRELRRRCEPFFELSRDDVIAFTQQQSDRWKKGDALDPGELALKYLKADDKQKALAVVRDVLSSRDAYAIASMREFVHQYLVLQVDAQALPGSTRTDLKSLALTVAACDLGLDCSEQSLTALQLCAHSGYCLGGVIDRYAQSLPNPTDREQLAVESRRVAAAIAAGDLKALGLTAE
jgi:hypothetical protein